VFGLAVKEPANACIVGGAPEQEYDSEHGYSGAFWQYIEGEDQAGEDGEDCCVGEVFWLRGGEKLRDHVVSMRHNED
jgi:hypothetical protein